MFTSHPYQQIPPKRRPAVFALFLLLTALLTGVLQFVDGPLKTAAAPYGIVSYELAGSVATAQRILDSWNDAARIQAGFSLGLDYLYMPAYAVTIGLACAWMAQAVAGKRRWAGWLGVVLAWALLAASLLDACENAALLTQLLLLVRDPWPTVAWICASVKFFLIAVGLVYALICAALWPWRRGRAA